MEVTLQNIRKVFGPVIANDDINLTFASGNIYGVLGENGAGKSTLMKILSGFQPPDSGEILIDQKEVHFHSPKVGLEHGLGMLYQDPLDFPPFDIIENYLLGKDNKLILDRKGAAEDLKELADRYGFTVDIEARIDSLSIGERQQLELVRLLAGGAELLILDEPTTGISAEQKRILFDSILKMAKVNKKIVILVSHKLEEIQELCSQAYILRKGKIVGQSQVPCPNEVLVKMMFETLPPKTEKPALVTQHAMIKLEGAQLHPESKYINLTIQEGEVFGLAGLEGSGQELFLRTLAGLSDFHAGEIIIDGDSASGISY
ncbi:MAG: ATP-binding cassette domain-containing protein, partial [Chloroflexota bacterium]